MNKTMWKILEYTQWWYNIWTWIYLAKKDWDIELEKLINKWAKFKWTDEEFTKKYLK